MIKKMTAAGLVAGAAMGALLMGAPAHAGDKSFEQEFEQESVSASIQECEATLASGVVALNIPILSPQTNGNCESGAIGGNYSK